MSYNMDTLLLLIRHYHNLGWLQGHGKEAGYMSDKDLDSLARDIDIAYTDIKGRVYDLYVQANGGILP